ncbi:hypothetical protein Tco_1232877, partial [Tanacetum coccineum]
SILVAGNPVKEILLNLNLPDHRFIANCFTADSYKDGVELKNIKKDGYTRFQHQEQYEHVSSKVTSAQVGKRSQDDDKRLCLADDLKKLKITFMSSVTEYGGGILEVTEGTTGDAWCTSEESTTGPHRKLLIRYGGVLFSEMALNSILI